jgi:hypothetical protein
MLVLVESKEVRNTVGISKVSFKYTQFRRRKHSFGDSCELTLNKVDQIRPCYVFCYLHKSIRVSGEATG